MLNEEVRDFLRGKGIRLDTDKGQHFLIDEDVLQEIVAIADIQPTDRIVEIGPGIGILTRELLKHAAHVTAIEIDPSLIPLLRVFTGIGNPKLEIVVGNALQIPMPISPKRLQNGANHQDKQWEGTSQKSPHARKQAKISRGVSPYVERNFGEADEAGGIFQRFLPYKVVANIPYHITSPLLTHLLLESTVRPTSMTMLIQREVAENICSPESDSLLTILVRLYGKPLFVRRVGKDAFLPPPKVESAVLHIDCFPEPLTDKPTTERMLKLAKLAFSKRRKMLSNTIGEMPRGADAMQAAGIDAKRRPQTLTIDEWIVLEAAIRNAKDNR